MQIINMTTQTKGMICLFGKLSAEKLSPRQLLSCYNGRERIKK